MKPSLIIDNTVTHVNVAIKTKTHLISNISLKENPNDKYSLEDLEDITKQVVLFSKTFKQCPFPNLQLRVKLFRSGLKETFTVDEVVFGDNCLTIIVI